MQADACAEYSGHLEEEENDFESDWEASGPYIALPYPGNLDIEE